MSDDDVLTNFSNTVATDLLRAFCGEVVGSGVARTVYECTVRPDLVVKVETVSASFQNVMEWELWQKFKDNKSVSKWLAPCELMSPCGTVMVQHRTTPLARDRYPAKLPEFLTDQKWSNYGMIGDRFVCHDYGMIRARVQLQMLKTEWKE